MPAKAKELSPLAVKRLAAPGLHAVGGVAGLYLQVAESGGRSWILRSVVGAKRKDMGLGGFPDVSLAQARERAQAMRQAIREGRDPVAERLAAKRALIAAQQATLTFRTAAEHYREANEAGWKNAKHRAQVRSTLAK